MHSGQVPTVKTTMASQIGKCYVSITVVQFFPVSSRRGPAELTKIDHTDISLQSADMTCNTGSESCYTQGAFCGDGGIDPVADFNSGAVDDMDNSCSSVCHCYGTTEADAYGNSPSAGSGGPPPSGDGGED